MAAASPAISPTRAQLVQRRPASLLAVVSSTASVDLDCETRSWSTSLLAAVSSTVPVDRDCDNRGWPAILLAAVSSIILVDRDCKTRSCSTSLLAVVSSTVSVDRDCQMQSCSASLLAAVSSTVSVDWDYETQSCSASLLAAAGYRLFGPCRRSLALLLSPPASDVPFRPRILHGLDVFAVQRVYREEQLRFGGRSAGGRHFRHHTTKKFWERNCNLPR